MASSEFKGACATNGKDPPQCNRRPNHRAPRLCHEPIAAADYRADVWVAQIGGRDEEGKTARSGEGELAVPVRGGGIQPVENPKTSSGKSVVASAIEPNARRSGADRGPKDQENVTKT